MFDLFRSRDKAVRILLTVILGVVALSMVTYLIPGSGMGGGGDTDANVIATVGDQPPITVADAQRVIQGMMRGRQLPPEILSVYAPQLINNLITERAVAYEAKRLGFVASEAETAQAVRGVLPQQLFQDGKLINKDVYVSLLAQQGLTVEQFESQAAEQVTTNRLRDIITAGVVISPLEVEQEFRRRNEKAKIDYVLIPVAKYSAEATVSDAELKSYFDKHRADYQIPERKSLAVLVIDPAVVQNEIQPTDAELQKLYQSNLDAFRTPERVKYRHILVKADASNDAQAKAKILDIEKQLKAGANFGELAKKYSEDPGSKDKGGEGDWIQRGQTVKEFEAAAFSLPLHQLSAPIKTMFGYHLLEVTDKEPARLRTFEEAKPELLAQYRGKRLNDMLQSAEDKAIATLRKDPAHPEKAAQDAKAQLFTVPNYSPGDPIPGVGVSKELDGAVAGLKKAEISQPVVLTGNKIVIADVTNTTPSHPANFDEVEGQIRSKLNADKVQQIVSQKANELLAKAKAAGDLKKAAKEMGLEAKSSDDFLRSGAIEGLGSATSVGDAFNRPVGTVLGPLPVQGSQAIIQVTGHTEANMAEFPVQRDAIRGELFSSRAREREALFAAGLKKRLEDEKKIKVHNDVIKRLIDSYSRS